MKRAHSIGHYKGTTSQQFKKSWEMIVNMDVNPYTKTRKQKTLRKMKKHINTEIG